MPLGFVHATETNHQSLSLVGGGRVVPLPSGRAVLSGVDPLWIYNWVFGVRRALALDAARAAFAAAGRRYVHVLASPSSRQDLPAVLAELGFRQIETQSYRRAEGTGAGAPKLEPFGRSQAEEFAELALSAPIGGERHDARRQAYVRRFADGRSRAFRTPDGSGGFLLFDDGPTTQLCHLAVRPAEQGRGLGRRLLAQATGLVARGRPLWLFTALGGSADRTAEAAGWRRSHTAGNWLLEPAGTDA